MLVSLVFLSFLMHNKTFPLRGWGEDRGKAHTSQKFVHTSPHQENFPTTKGLFPQQITIFMVKPIKTSLLAAAIFILTSYSLYTQVMLILILINI